ncbi:MAG TPA: CpsB/CapC family capsule biosynthesis tyrosine phosphatase [Limnochordia bacterium]
MIDLHIHLLPGVDDGPASWSEAVLLARRAVAEGVRTAVVTPHQIPDGPFCVESDHIREGVAELAERLQREEIPLCVLPGAEVRLTPGTAAGLSAGEWMSLGDRGRAVLIELPPGAIPLWTDQALFEIQLSGLVPLIAHAERHEGLAADVAAGGERVRAWVERGIRLQVNASSLVRRRGRRARIARRLLRAGWVHAVASDAHSLRRRPPEMGRGREAVRRLLGPRAAESLTSLWPAALLDGRALSAPAEERVPRWWWPLGGRWRAGRAR